MKEQAFHGRDLSTGCEDGVSAHRIQTFSLMEIYSIQQIFDEYNIIQFDSALFVLIGLKSVDSFSITGTLTVVSKSIVSIS